MFELWLFDLIEILDEWEGYGKASVETLDVCLDNYRSKDRDTFLDNSYWDKL